MSPEEVDRCATLSGKLLDRRYQVGRRLGEGGMSYVYRAQDVETGGAVAVKILLPRLSRDPAAVERLRREATIATRLSHPNVCPILRMGEADRMIYLVMPYLEGEPLSEHETRRGPFPVAGRRAAPGCRSAAASSTRTSSRSSTATSSPRTSCWCRTAPARRASHGSARW